MSHDIVQSKGDGMDVASWAVILVLVVSPFLVIGCIVCMIVCCDCNHYGEMVLPKKAPWFRKRLIKLSLVSKKVHDHPKLQRQYLCKSQPIVLRRVRPAQADNFTVATELELESQYNHSQCVICLETYNIGDSISWARNTMYCNHAFHTHCIQKWLKNKRSCPCCRYEILRWDDMHMRVNAWSDYCCGRRSRVRNDKMQRNLLHQCRETGEYCVEHGLVFPFVQPTLEDPYEAQISELEECLVLAKEHALRSRIKSSGAQQQQQHPHQCEEGSGAIVTTTRSTTNTAVESTAETTLEANDEMEGHVNCEQANVSSRESLSLSRQTNTTNVGLNGRGSLILFETANETDATNNTRSVRLQGILGAHAIPLRMSTARSYE